MGRREVGDEHDEAVRAKRHPMSSLRLALALIAATTVACSSSSTPVGDKDASSPDTAGPKSDAPANGDTTWNNYAEGFFKTYCVSCHDASTAPAPPQNLPQNFNVFADVKGLDSTIRCGVAPKTEPQSGCSASPYPAGQFPIGPGPYPTDADRLRIIAWINAGAPEN